MVEKGLVFALLRSNNPFQNCVKSAFKFPDSYRRARYGKTRKQRLVKVSEIWFPKHILDD